MKIFAKASCKIFVAHELGAYSVGIGKGVQHDITNYKDIVSVIRGLEYLRVSDA
jgi:hypothetical protein